VGCWLLGVGDDGVRRASRAADACETVTAWLWLHQLHPLPHAAAHVHVNNYKNHNFLLIDVVCFRWSLGGGGMPVLLSAACILFLLLATLIHSQQSETTSRLDFLWKLQANGQFLK
jgi:hypothetical protein